jgi:hypothetical protein
MTQALSPAESLSLWQNQPGLPPIDGEVQETHGRVGKYLVLWDIGSGEFGKVRACMGKEHSRGGKPPPGTEGNELALKSINKNNVSQPRHRLRTLGLFSP